MNQLAANQYDAIVVGAGPTGLACAIELGRRQCKTLVLEKGCLVNSIYHYPTNLVFFTTPELLEIGDIPMTSLNDKPNKIEALKYYRRVAQHYGLTIQQYEHVNQVEGSDGDFRVLTTDRDGCARSYSTSKVVLATGYYDVANRLNVPGEELPKVAHYYKDAHPFYNSDVLVVGAKNSAAIASLELLWYGARVTIVHRGPAISDSVKYWIKPNIENRIKSGEVKAYFHSRVVSIAEKSVVLETPQGQIALKNDYVLALIGYQPDVTFLNKVGVEIDPQTQRPCMNMDTLESRRPGLYLAGVIVAGMHTSEIFIENGRFHGKVIAQAIANGLKQSEPGA
jgi:thioredoxin reductase (NADPH)